MLHPSTELRFISDEIGHGIFATEDIPKGTITWVKDELDREFTPQEVDRLSELNRNNLLKYTYRNNKGNYLFCWDLTRYVNHSFHPNSMLTALGFEIAIKDIHKGDEITNDYGTFNIIEAFQCANDPQHIRSKVQPDDLNRYYKIWDEQISNAFVDLKNVIQPLAPYLTSAQNEKIVKIQTRELEMPSVIYNLYEGFVLSKT